MPDLCRLVETRGTRARFYLTGNLGEVKIFSYLRKFFVPSIAGPPLPTLGFSEKYAVLNIYNKINKNVKV